MGNLFNVDFQSIQNDLQAKGLDSSSNKSFVYSRMFFFFIRMNLVADEIHRLISTGSILFYFLYYSQKTCFPVNLNAIQEFISKARTELESVGDHVSIEEEKKKINIFLFFSL